MNTLDPQPSTKKSTKHTVSIENKGGQKLKSNDKGNLMQQTDSSSWLVSQNVVEQV